MALHRSKPSDIPEGAVLLSKEEAVEYQLTTFYNWRNWKDVFFVKYGCGMLAGAASATGIYINRYYRHKLLLRSFGKGSSFAAIAVIPAGLTMLFHYTLVMPSLILQDTCPVCIEMRAAALQAMIGCLLPMALAPISGFSTALNYGTYNVPYLSEPKKVLTLWKQLTVPKGNIFFALFLTNALFACGITLLEARNIQTVNLKLDLIDSQKLNTY